MIKPPSERLRDGLNVLAAAAESLDIALEFLATASDAMHAAVTQVNQLGCDGPSHDRLDEVGAAVIHRALVGTPWGCRFEYVGRINDPHQAFTDMVEAWMPPIERRIDELGRDA
jgi:hypothetical protein